MKLAAHQDGQRFFVAAKEVQQGDIFEQEVLALVHDAAVPGQKGEPLPGRDTRALLQQVEFEQDARVAPVEGKGPFQSPIRALAGRCCLLK